MKIPDQLNHSFSARAGKGGVPTIASFHSYPKHAAVRGSRIQSDAWAIEYHDKYAGKVFLKTLSNEMKREKNTIHLYSPGCVYWEDTRDADLPIQDTYLLLAESKRTGLENLVTNELGFARFRDPDHIVGSLFKEMRTACALPGDAPFWLAQSGLMKILHYMLNAARVADHEYLVSTESSVAGQTPFSHAVEDYLRKNLGRKVTLSEIADTMDVSESMLSHTFREETGISPVARHTELRIEFAKRLILKGERLRSVAEMTGYSDEFHLSKVFKATTGLSPRVFRKTTA